MMNCQEFKDWVVEKELSNQKTTASAQGHMEVCAACKKLYTVDAMLDAQVARSLVEVEPPPTLLSQIETDIHSAHGAAVTPASRWKIFAPALAVAAIVLLIIISPFSGQIRGIEDIGAMALANHLDDGMKMSFKADEISDVSGWFYDQLGFNFEIPDLAAQGFAFIGGRKCTLGKKNAAYLYYDRQGSRCSVFIINDDGLNLKMEPKRIYQVGNETHNIKVWQDNSLIYASVE